MDLAMYLSQCNFLTYRRLKPDRDEDFSTKTWSWTFFELSSPPQSQRCYPCFLSGGQELKGDLLLLALQDQFLCPSPKEVHSHSFCAKEGSAFEPLHKLPHLSSHPTNHHWLKWAIHHLWRGEEKWLPVLE